ncbi:MAG: hypothetical protein CMN97_09615 [Synechococcus sp. NAT40]|nr:hypothetical protein [Synechococcus sp. NAT40]
MKGTAATSLFKAVDLFGTSSELVRTCQKGKDLEWLKAIGSGFQSAFIHGLGLPTMNQRGFWRQSQKSHEKRRCLSNK